MSEPENDAASPPWTAGAAWIDGRYCPVGDARISVLDLGVTRSDCTYDVVHVWQGRFYRLDAHLDRFAASMARLRLDPGQDRAGIEDILHGCVRRAGLRDAYVSMTCTRGRMLPGSRDLRTARNSFYCYALPFIWISRPEQQETGARMRISELTRIPPQSVDPTVKNYHWLDLDLALLDAYDHDADLVVLRDLSGAITEGAGYNVFAHVDGRWLTPGHGTLAGITRRSLIELAREAGPARGRGRADRGRPAPGGRGPGHLHGGRDHAGHRRGRRPGRHGRPRPPDPRPQGPLLGQPPGPPLLHPRPLRPACPPAQHPIQWS